MQLGFVENSQSNSSPRISFQKNRVIFIERALAAIKVCIPLASEIGWSISFIRSIWSATGKTITPNFDSHIDLASKKRTKIRRSHNTEERMKCQEKRRPPFWEGRPE